MDLLRACILNYFLIVVVEFVELDVYFFFIFIMNNSR